jgi:glycopeptide antibiotics resistance protein
MENIAGNYSMIFFRKAILLILKIIFSLGYSSIFLYVLFFARRRRHLTERFLNLVPVKGTIDNFHKLNPDHNHEVFNFYSNLVGNMILFIPFSIILISLFGINYKKTMFAAFVVSILVELLQFILKRGVADVDDVLLNMIGAVSGCIIYDFISTRKSLKNEQK